MGESPASTESLPEIDAVKVFIEKNYKEYFDSAKSRLDRSKKLEEDIKDCGDYEKEKRRSNHRVKEEEFLRVRRTRLTREHFRCLKVIGKGTFGEVKLVQMNNGNIFALKVLMKEHIIKSNNITSVRSERDILSELDTPWVVKMFFSFQDSKFLYLVMEFCPGGDLIGLLMKCQIFTQEQAAFYFAEIAIAIDFIHNLSIIHRDIKPDNLLIDKDGHIKLGDFGMCTSTKIHRSSKFLLETEASDTEIPTDTMDSRTKTETWRKKQRQMAFSIVGTPYYIAPEVYKNDGSGYTKSCDWWSLGIILYEMLVGCVPFFHDDPRISLCMLKEWEQHFGFPSDAVLTQEAKNMIKCLISHPQDRYDSLCKVRNHEFLKGINVDNIRSQKPPFPIEIKSIDDTSYFDDFEHESIPWDDPVDKSASRTNYKDDKEWMFLNFTFKRFENMV